MGTTTEILGIEKIKNRRKEVMNEAQTDLKINVAKLLEENVRTFLMFQKYWRYLEEAKEMLMNCDFRYQRTLHKRTEYYLGKGPPQAYKDDPLPIQILKADVARYLNADEEVALSLRLLHEAKMFVDYLETLIKNHINNRGFAIRDMIEWKKFTNGQE